MQDTALVLVRVEGRAPVDRKSIVTYDRSTKAVTEIYRSQGLVLRDPGVSADGRYVSFVEAIGPRPRTRRLVILELSTNRARTIDVQARVSTWCCGRGKLAVVTGSTFEGGIGFMPDDLLIIDAESGGRIAVEGVPAPYQLHWAAFDSSLYIKSLPGPEAKGVPNADSVVYRYEISTGRLHQTTRRGVFFSPDGRFYFDFPTPTGGFTVYRSSDDREMKWALPKEVDGRAPRGEWVPNSDHALVFTEREIPPGPPPLPTDPPRLTQPGEGRENVQAWNVMLDAETGLVIGRFQGGLRSGWRSNAKALVLARNTGPELVTFRRK